MPSSCPNYKQSGHMDKGCSGANKANVRKQVWKMKKIVVGPENVTSIPAVGESSKVLEIIQDGQEQPPDVQVIEQDIVQEGAPAGAPTGDPKAVEFLSLQDSIQQKWG
ncbi:hypothetical protein V6N13_098886 [Hibiscus sabdariffa]|uniref:Uncharacterized protein n=1 Tax=Hibiscus sabdariffa TaxID=183260 RepID=A0ABR2EF77_9ROSI